MLAITFISNLRPTICNEVTHLTADHICVSLYIASLYTRVKEWVNVLRLGSERRGTI